MKHKQTEVIQIKPEISEHIGIDYETTGCMGGDAGHGAYTKLKFYIENGATDVTIQDETGKVIFDGSNINSNGSATIEISACGDWESAGFTKNLKLLGLRLLNEEVIKSSNH
jgi:hypothetical protein